MSDKDQIFARELLQRKTGHLGNGWTSKEALWWPCLTSTHWTRVFESYFKDLCPKRMIRRGNVQEGGIFMTSDRTFRKGCWPWWQKDITFVGTAFGATIVCWTLPFWHHHPMCVCVCVCVCVCAQTHVSGYPGNHHKRKVKERNCRGSNSFQKGHAYNWI